MWEVNAVVQAIPAESHPSNVSRCSRRIGVLRCVCQTYARGVSLRGSRGLGRLHLAVLDGLNGRFRVVPEP